MSESENSDVWCMPALGLKSHNFRNHFHLIKKFDSFSLIRFVINNTYRQPKLEAIIADVIWRQTWLIFQWTKLPRNYFFIHSPNSSSIFKNQRYGPLVMWFTMWKLFVFNFLVWFALWCELNSSTWHDMQVSGKVQWWRLFLPEKFH